jgi:polyhydroxybutyrate depolymerase
MSREGWHATRGLVQHEFDAAGLTRSFWLAPPPASTPAPLLVALHGLGMTGKDMAAFTGLGTRGPAAGFTTVFPDAFKQVWDAHEEIDDGAFIAALTARLAADGLAREAPVILAGISNGAMFAERLAREGVLDTSVLVLAAGTGGEYVRRSTPLPVAPATVLWFQGTGDRGVRYAGGQIGFGGVFGWFARRKRRVARTGVAVETVARDWAQAAGAPENPAIERLEITGEELPVTLMQWGVPGRPYVVLYRIEGGGHGWPGGPQYLPARAIGPVPRGLDATGIMLDLARRQSALR